MTIWNSNKGLGSEDSHKESTYGEESDDECKLKKDSSLSSTSVEQIQNLIANVIKVKLKANSLKNSLVYKTLYKDDFICHITVSHLSF